MAAPLTTPRQLQALLAATGHYAGPQDGLLGPASRAAILGAMQAQTTAPLTREDLSGAAGRLGCQPAAVAAVVAVESGPTGFDGSGRPLILPEPHKFHAATGGKWAAKYPALSYPKWGALPYPRTSNQRYAALVDMVCLDVDAGYASCSYGRFQILGSNYAACGLSSPAAHALSHAVSEVNQLRAWERFVAGNARMHAALRGLDWTTFARLYNGPQHARNDYVGKLQRAYAKAS